MQEAPVRARFLTCRHADMLDWLSRNENLVQAIASIISVLVTVILAWITYSYVLLTQRLVESSDAQLSLLRASVSARINTLAGYVRTMQLLLAELPETRDGAGRMKTAALWSGDNVAELQRLASEHSREAGERAAELVPSLKWIRERVDTVKDADGNVDWDDFPWEEWSTHRGRVESGLQHINNSLPSEDELWTRRRTDRQRKSDT